MRNNGEKGNYDTGLSAIVYGKMQPQAIELEEAVLGALMLDEETSEVITTLSPDIFYDPRNETIFAAIQSLHKRNAKIDLLTVTQELMKMGKLEEAGGPYYVNTLCNRVANGSHIEEHTQILLQKKFSRDIIKIGSQAVHDAYEDTIDVFELMEKVEQNFAEAAGSIVSNNIMHISEVVKEFEQEKRETVGELGEGVSTGFRDIDDLGTPQKGDLVIWAGRTSMGKTAAMVSAAMRQAKRDIPVGIISMEMTRRQLLYRMISLETGIFVKRIQANDIHESERQKYDEAIELINSLPIYIEDAPNQTLSQFKTKATRMKRKFGIQILYGDHLGKLKIPSLMSFTYQMVTEIVREVKSLAKILEIPITMLVQLNRKTEQTKDMRPMLSNLRDSGAIEEEADQVGLFYRPEYYHKQGLKGYDSVLVDGETIDSKGYAEVNYAKNRNGEVKIVKLHFKDYCMKFEDFEGKVIVHAKTVNNFYEPKEMEELPEFLK